MTPYNGYSGSFELLVMDKLMGISHSLGSIEGQVQDIPEMKEQISDIKIQLAQRQEPAPKEPRNLLPSLETVQKHIMWAIWVATAAYSFVTLASGRPPATPPVLTTSQE